MIKEKQRESNEKKNVGGNSSGSSNDAIKTEPSERDSEIKTEADEPSEKSNTDSPNNPQQSDICLPERK